MSNNYKTKVGIRTRRRPKRTGLWRGKHAEVGIMLIYAVADVHGKPDRIAGAIIEFSDDQPLMVKMLQS